MFQDKVMSSGGRAQFVLVWWSSLCYVVVVKQGVNTAGVHYCLAANVRGLINK